MSNGENTTVKGSKSKYVIAVILFLFSLLFLGLWESLPTIDPSKTTDIRILLELANEITDTVRPEEHPPEYPVIVTGHPDVKKTAFDLLGLKMGPFLAIKRIVQIYAWAEEEVPKDQLPKDKKLTLEDRYRYHLEWQENPKEYRDLKVWKGHMFGMPSIINQNFYGGPLYFGRISLNLNNAEILIWEDYRFKDGFEFYKELVHDEKYVYRSEESRSDPTVADVRLHYKVLRKPDNGQPITVFGARNYNQLTYFKTADGQNILYLYPGSIDEMKDFIGHPPISVNTIRILQLVLPSVAALFLLLSILMILKGIKLKTQ